ncbi:MAG TPA: AMP-binding protein, partial [Terriglobales bacterium]|nr:AMP-binding protein [Terriglobales bacterium]
MNSTAASDQMSVRNLIESQVNTNPHVVAILGTGLSPISYEALLAQVDQIAAYVQSFGIRSHDRVASVMPNGPQALVVFLGVTTVATYAPLNPQLTINEITGLLFDLQAKALIVDPTVGAAAITAANDLGIQVLEVAPLLQHCAAPITRNSCANEKAQRLVPNSLTDIALTLHTSGTTSKPKLVPLTHENLCTSARNTVAALGLSTADRCLNVMPMFHIHALMASLASIAAGGSVICASGAEPNEFFVSLKQYRPSWYTASPAIHQMILRGSADYQETLKSCPLRFIRSSSSALPEQVLRELEETFLVPVIECYAMTEASYQITANPVCWKRKIGSVGMAAGPDLGIMDHHGELLPPNSPGEVVIRGTNVMGGYENNPNANLESFHKGWFRTGDIGFLDHEGYLFLKGRTKEIINKGGE